jgi:hypothetical protein
MIKPIAIQIALWLWTVLLGLLSLPLVFLAIFSLEKFLVPTNTRHALLELALLIGSVSGLASPLAFISSHRSVQVQLLAVSTIAVAVAIGALYSPLCRGFIH